MTAVGKQFHTISEECFSRIDITIAFI